MSINARMGDSRTTVTMLVVRGKKTLTVTDLDILGPGCPLESRLCMFEMQCSDEKCAQSRTGTAAQHAQGPVPGSVLGWDSSSAYVWTQGLGFASKKYIQSKLHWERPNSPVSV